LALKDIEIRGERKGVAWRRESELSNAGNAKVLAISIAVGAIAGVTCLRQDPLNIFLPYKTLGIGICPMK
jgi:hypothetical protein